MATIDMSYDDPTYTVMRQESHTSAVATAGLIPAFTFRSHVAAVVTGVAAIMGGSLALTASMILTLLFNGSVRAVLTLHSTINDTVGFFTLTANSTLASMTDRFEVSTAASYSADGHCSVVYEYRIAPTSTYSIAAALT